MLVTETVILAAGLGQRLNGSLAGSPKPVVSVAGRSLLQRALEQAFAAGCVRAVVVVGNGAAAVRSHLAQLDAGLDVEIVLNEGYTGPNGGSLLGAEGHVHGPFYLQMVDHVFAAPVLGLLSEVGDLAAGEGRLLVDHDPAGIDEEDATKVRGDGGLAVAIGKKISSWNAVDAGVFLLDPGVFDTFRERPATGETPTVSALMQRLADAGRLRLVSIGRVPWADVDTPADLAAAESLLREQEISRLPRPPARRCG